MNGTLSKYKVKLFEMEEEHENTCPLKVELLEIETWFGA